MSYDRLGRRAPTPSELDESDGAIGASATPNAARLARGREAVRATRGAKANPAAPVSSSARGKQNPAAKSPAANPKAKRGPAAFRILPATAFVSALVLSIKVADLWEHRDGLVEMVSVGTVAVAADSAPGKEPGTADAGTSAARAIQQLAQAESTSGGAVAPGDKVDPFNLGKSQIELLQSLAERRRELEDREQTLVQREGLLAAAEHRIDQKIGELNGIKAEIEELIRKYDKQEEDQLSGLVKIYETMKPKDAARIFDELDMDILLQVIERMKASKTAPVLANMTPERAKEVTSRIAERRSMPDIN